MGSLVDQLLCRRLLLALDRVPSGALMMTQELLAGLRGVRREGVTAARLRLQAAGAIRCSRGRIDLLDRAQLALPALDRPLGRPHSDDPPRERLAGLRQDFRAAAAANWTQCTVANRNRTRNAHRLYWPRAVCSSSMVNVGSSSESDRIGP